MKMPDFLIIGAAKSGTTALYHVLSQHPEVYLPAVKEVNFFAFVDRSQCDINECEQPEVGSDKESLNRYREGIKSSVTTLDDYRSLFSNVATEKVMGEVSPFYMYHPQAPYCIRHLAGDAKLIAVLRNPVDRAFSHYLHYVRDGIEPVNDFLDALRLEDLNGNVLQGFRHYVRAGFYNRQLERYYNLFPRDQIKIILFDDLRANFKDVIDDLCRFIGVEEGVLHAASGEHNVSGVPKSRWKQKLLSPPEPVVAIVRKYISSRIFSSLKTIKHANLVKPELPEDAREYLMSLFSDEIDSLEKLIRRDLGAWKFSHTKRA